MGDELYRPTMSAPLRMMIIGSAEPSWYDASDEVRSDVVLPVLIGAFARWKSWGARLLTSFDDDLLMVGTPRIRKGSFYLVYEVEGLAQATAMINLFRLPVKEVRLDMYFSLTATLGRHFFPAEDT